MNNKFINRFFTFLILFLFATMFANAQALEIQNIYQHLNSAYPQYNQITFSKPTTNILTGNWLIQSPNIWGKQIAVYNKSFEPTGSNKIDPEFDMPTCKTNNDCQGYAICQQPDYTLNIHKQKKSLCTTSADQILQNIYSAITSAQHSVDITTLQPAHFFESSFTTQAFTATITNALIVLAEKTLKTHTPIQVRFIQGTYLPITENNSLKQQQAELKQLAISQNEYLKKLVSALPKGNKLEISVASMRSCESGVINCGNEDQQHDPYLDFAWNHGKIIDIDNHILITGGHNLWGQDYLQTNPVNDLSIEISGPIATGATTYANTIWNYVCRNKGILANLYETYKDGKISETCLPNIDPTLDSHVKTQKIDDNSLSVSAMYVSKLNNNVLADDADQSELARVYAFNNAQHIIKISQQALFAKGVGDVVDRPILHPLNTKDGTVMQALANAIYKHVSVYIVTSTLGGSGYSSNVSLEYIWKYLLNQLVTQHKIDSSTASSLLRTYLHLGDIAYNSAENEDKSHDKLWIVDDKLFYIGSHNIYPSSLQQFGIIIESAAATAAMEQALWDPIWQYSHKYMPA